MAEISDFLYNLLKNFNLNLLLMSFFILQLIFFILQVYLTVKYAKKNIKTGIKQFFYFLSVVNILPFLLSFYITDKIYRCASVFILLEISSGLFILAYIFIRNMCFKGKKTFFTAFDPNIIPADENTDDTDTTNGNVEFDLFIANLKAKTENGENTLSEIALYISKEREKEKYLPEQKKILNVELGEILKSMTVK